MNPYSVNDPNDQLELPLPAELLFDDMGKKIVRLTLHRDGLAQCAC